MGGKVEKIAAKISSNEDSVRDSLEGYKNLGPAYGSDVKKIYEQTGKVVPEDAVRVYMGPHHLNGSSVNAVLATDTYKHISVFDATFRSYAGVTHATYFTGQKNLQELKDIHNLIWENSDDGLKRALRYL